jgi:hypothetical protein
MPRKKDMPLRAELTARLEAVTSKAAQLKARSEKLYRDVDSAHHRAEELHERVRDMNRTKRRKAA